VPSENTSLLVVIPAPVVFPGDRCTAYYHHTGKWESGFVRQVSYTCSINTPRCVWRYVVSLDPKNTDEECELVIVETPQIKPS